MKPYCMFFILYTNTVSDLAPCTHTYTHSKYFDMIWVINFHWISISVKRIEKSETLLLRGWLNKIKRRLLEETRMLTILAMIYKVKISEKKGLKRWSSYLELHFLYWFWNHWMRTNKLSRAIVSLLYLKGQHLESWPWK